LIGVVLAGTGGALTRRFALEVGGDRLVIPQFGNATILGMLAMPCLNTTPLSSIETQQWVLLLALGLIAAEVNPEARLGVAAYFVPVVAVTLAVVFLGENLTPAVVVGAILIISGVIITECSSRHVPVPGVDIAE
jgi:drug/metabolite transporter (DMT)-like permease